MTMSPSVLFLPWDNNPNWITRKTLDILLSIDIEQGTHQTMILKTIKNIKHAHSEETVAKGDEGDMIQFNVVLE